MGLELASTFGAKDNYQVRGQPSRTFLIISVITTTHEPTVYSTEHKDEGDTAHPNGRRDECQRRGGRGGEDRRRSPRVLVLRSQLSSTAAAHMAHGLGWTTTTNIA